MSTRTARCLCGQLSITVHGETLGTGVCHCLACQARTGSVFATLAGFSAPWEVSGRVGEYLHTGDLGGKYRFRFCPVCGANVFHTVEGDDAHVNVAVGCFGDPSFTPPMDSVYDVRRHPWVAVPAGCVVFAKDPP